MGSLRRASRLAHLAGARIMIVGANVLRPAAGVNPHCLHAGIPPHEARQASAVAQSDRASQIAFDADVTVLACLAMRHALGTDPSHRVRSSAVEHYLDMVGVTGSIPVAPTIRSTQPNS